MSNRCTTLSKTALVSLTLAIAACGAEGETSGNHDVQPVGVSQGPTIAEAAPATDVADLPIELALLQFEDQRSLRFSVDDEAGALIVEELGPVADIAMPLLLQDPMRELNALQIYMALTPTDRAVPRALYELGAAATEPAALEGRVLVESVLPMPAQLVTHRLVKTYQEAANMPALCGNNGANAFQQLCNSSNAPEQYCAPGKHTWHGRYSNSKYVKSEGLTVACQASVRTTHRRKIAYTWWQNTFHMDASQFWHFTRVENYAPASKYDRYVRMDRYNPTSPDTSVSYIRSWIGFRN